MDVFEALALKEVAEKQIEFALKYAKARREAAEAKTDLDILLAANFLNIRERKPNVGYEAALVMLMEGNDIAQELYKTMVEEKAKYKGLEKIVEALQNKISLAQSQMKYIDKGEKLGA